MYFDGDKIATSKTFVYGCVGRSDAFKEQFPCHAVSVI